MSATNYPRA